MTEIIAYMVHDNKPGVKAPMRSQEDIDRHEAGGWKVHKHDDTPPMQPSPGTVRELVAEIKRLGGKIPRNSNKDELINLWEGLR